MAAYTLRRLWQFVPTLAGVVLLVFFLFNWIGGDPAYILAGKISNPETIANIRRQLGVDQPYAVQLWIFLKQILSGDFGVSWATNESVSSTRIGSITVSVAGRRVANRWATVSLVAQLRPQSNVPMPWR